MQRMIVLLMLTAALAGCSDDPAETPEPTDPAPTDTMVEDEDTMEVNDTDEMEPVPMHTVTLTADVTEGPAPLNVTFSIEADADGSWALDFGNGLFAEGVGVPAKTMGKYPGGSYVATAVVTFADGTTAGASLNITAIVAPVEGGLFVPLNGTMNAFAPAGLSSPAGFCDLLHTAKDDGLNGTYIAYFEHDVPAGTKSLYIEGGTDPLDPQGLTPDFDIIIEDADLNCNVGGSEGSYETLEVPNPSPGPVTFAILYWTGPVPQTYFGHYAIVV